MKRNFGRTVLLLAPCIVALLGLLGGCETQSEQASDEVCARCEPSSGGETGDFGTELHACEAVMADEEVDRAEAEALGFDVTELERRVARPVDLPMRWVPAKPEWIGHAGGPATGYEPETRIRATFSSQRTLHYVHPDPEVCDGAICQLPGGGTEEQVNCTTRIELDIEVQLQTQDRAIKATLEGRAVWIDPEHRGLASDSLLEPYFNAHTDLAEVTGTLRLDPKPGAEHYVGGLFFSGRLWPDGFFGELSPRVLIDEVGVTFVDYAPLYGTAGESP